MMNKEMFFKSIHTLLFSWGSEAPAEVTWGLNELLDWYEHAYDIKFPDRFNEDGSNHAEVYHKLEQT